MSHSIDFYFDFSSPYSYIAAEVIEDFAAGVKAKVNWRPFLLGAAFKETGGKPLIEIPIKGAYHLKDFARSAAYYKVPFKLPSKFPANGLAAARAFYWIESQSVEKAQSFAHAVYRAYFAQDQDITDTDVIAAIGQQQGFTPEAVVVGSQDQMIKDKLRTVTETAIARGVFGAPFFFIGDEPFWGVDRLPMMEMWLATNGWRY